MQETLDSRKCIISCIDLLSQSILFYYYYYALDVESKLNIAPTMPFLCAFKLFKSFNWVIATND